METKMEMEMKMEKGGRRRTVLGELFWAS